MRAAPQRLRVRRSRGARTLEPELPHVRHVEEPGLLPDRGVLLTPDQRVRVFISSTLGERHLTQGAAMNSDEAVTCALEQLDTAETTSLGPVRGT